MDYNQMINEALAKVNKRQIEQIEKCVEGTVGEILSIQSEIKRLSKLLEEKKKFLADLKIPDPVEIR